MDKLSGIWVFACLLEELADPKNVVVRNIPGHSIIIKSTSAGVKAFANVCAHRGMLLVGDGIAQYRGPGKLYCQYHGWTYKDDGCLHYGFGSECAPSKPKLLSYPVAVCGRFVFVGINPDQTLSEWLTPGLFDDLEMISLNIDAPVSSLGDNRVEFKSNWKLVVENTLEGVHVSGVHAETLGKAQLNPRGEYIWAGAHSKMFLPYHKEKISSRLEFARKYKPGGFVHWLVFPNLSIGSLDGLSYYIGSIWPKAGRSEFEFDVFSARVDSDESTELFKRDAINSTLESFTRKTLEEDAAICERLEIGVSCRGPEQIHTQYDQRVVHFREALKKYCVEA